LKSLEYMESRIKKIGDEDLFSSLGLTRPGLNNVGGAIAEMAFPKAYRTWAAYWGRKEQPEYGTQSEHLFILLR